MSIQAQILNLLRALQRELGPAYLFISHDLRVVAALASKLIVMRQGKVVEEGRASKIFAFRGLERVAVDEAKAGDIIALAGFLCCVTMSMPQQHLVAFCSDLGISATLGATMLSVLLGMGFFSRQGWGWLSDRMGGVLTAFCSSILQCAAMSGFG